MKGNILTFEVPRSYFSNTDSLFLRLHLTDIKTAVIATDDAHGDAPWKVGRMTAWMERVAETGACAHGRDLPGYSTTDEEDSSQG